MTNLFEGRESIDYMSFLMKFTHSQHLSMAKALFLLMTDVLHLMVLETMSMFSGDSAKISVLMVCGVESC